MFKVLGTPSWGHLFFKWEDQERPPRTRDIAELDLETQSAMLAHQDTQHIFNERKKEGRKRRKKEGWERAKG